jgi:fluoride exporter
VPDAAEPRQLPVDPDVDLHIPAQREELHRAPWATLGAISAGGVVGSLARHGLAAAYPHPPDGFGWAIFAVNVTGCLLIGMLMVVVTEVRRVHPLTRPFLGVGVLGGFTTFSTYVLETQDALAAGAPRTALAYLVGTALAALAAAFTGVWVMRRLTRRIAGAGVR